MVDLAQQLADGVQALKEGRPQDAADLLRPVAESPDLAAADDLRDVHARTWSLLAQALLDAGRASEARQPVQRALDLLEELDDPEGLAEVRDLQTRIGEAVSEAFQQAARRRELTALAERPLSDVLAGIEDPRQRLALHVRRTTAALEAGRPDEAAALARAAVPQARALEDVRHLVLALIALAQADRDAALDALLQAHAAADTANETALVGAVARTAAELDLTLPPPQGP